MVDDITPVHRGRIFKTEDGGLNWEHQSTAYPDDPVLAHLPDFVYFFDANDGITAGDYGEIYITKNRGTSWAAYEVGLGESNIYASFQDELTGLATAPLIGKGIAKSTDGGVTWEVLETQIPINAPLFHVTGSANTYMYGSGGFDIFLGTESGSGFTSDDGATWQNPP
ncbi:MAG: hypothetical protein KAJ19_16330 [Gammaproteobacteria bacterium]|nr:hypothetical protein [Gammaproteobacteria bacterium]